MDRILQSLTRLPLAVALLAAVLMTGCDDDQPDEEQLVVGLGHALSAETESEALVSDAVRCACGPTCVIAVKQHIRGDVLVRFGWEIGSALAEGALKALPLADKTKEAIEAGLEAVDAGVALGMHGDFVRTVEWDQNPTYEINKGNGFVHTRKTAGASNGQHAFTFRAWSELTSLGCSVRFCPGPERCHPAADPAGNGILTGFPACPC
ncbi:MAG: hypothetical protein P8Z31_04665 [Gammaproteobacteria bacterium]